MCVQVWRGLVLPRAPWLKIEPEQAGPLAHSISLEHHDDSIVPFYESGNSSSDRDRDWPMPQTHPIPLSPSLTLVQCSSLLAFLSLELAKLIPPHAPLFPPSGKSLLQCLQVTAHPSSFPGQNPFLPQQWS